ncbi:MAG: DUF192 domain-containing protein [bacterium]
MIRLTSILLFTFCLSALNCEKTAQQTEKKEQASSETETPPKKGMHTILIEGIPLQVEIAQDEEKSRKGLMFRQDLAENEGMLFVFSSQRILSFWMSNTYIPLDIAFIDQAGVIVDIQRMEPLDETKSYLSRAPSLYALEVNAGWFEKHNIKVGSRVRL